MRPINFTGEPSPVQERRALPEAERRRYGDTYVAVLGGEVVDQDDDRLALLRRVRGEYAKEPVLITPAAADAPREFLRLGLRRAGS